MIFNGIIFIRIFFFFLFIGYFKKINMSFCCRLCVFIRYVCGLVSGFVGLLISLNGGFYLIFWFWICRMKIDMFVSLIFYNVDFGNENFCWLDKKNVCYFFFLSFLFLLFVLIFMFGCIFDFFLNIFGLFDIFGILDLLL